MSSNANVQVTLKLQVGVVEVPLSQLLELSVDQVLTGDSLVSYFPKVRVVLNDKTLCEGELVNIDGKLGVRISQVL